MRAFLWSMALQALLLILLFAAVWKYTIDVLDRETLLASHVLPQLALAHDFTSATAGLQAQGLLLRGAESLDDLQLRKRLLEGSIGETRLLIHANSAFGSEASMQLAGSIDQIQLVGGGLSDVRRRQIEMSGSLQKEAAERIAQLDELQQRVQDRVVLLTDRLLVTHKALSAFVVDRRLDYIVQDENRYFSTLDQFESSSLVIQDYLLFNQDLIGLKSILERLPLIRSAENIALAEQNRDLLIHSMVSRAVYIRDSVGSEMLFQSLTNIRQALREEGNVFAQRKRMLSVLNVQGELSAQLARLTIDVPEVTEQIRNEAENLLLQITNRTRIGLERYRVFLFIVLLLSALILGSVAYWLLYKRTVLPLGEIASQLDEVGTERFRSAKQDYFISEIQRLARVVGELDEAQRQMRIKDEELKHSNNELLKANEDLEQFVHIASHDLQEPLRKLQQFSSLLTEDYGDKLGKDGGFYLTVIATSARRMSTLIRDTLAYSRSGRQDMIREEVDLNEVLRAAQEDADFIIAEAGARVIVGELPTVTASRVSVVQLFGNLLINALKYRRQDVECRVSVQARIPGDEPVVIIDVQDNGIGIDEQNVERVFMPFERLETNSTSGTGLGLAISAKVCAAHGWHISLTSEPGEGTCFHIAIPRERVVSSCAALPMPN